MNPEVEKVLETIKKGDVCFTVYKDGSKSLEAISLVTNNIDSYDFTDVKSLNFGYDQDVAETWIADSSLIKIKVLFNVSHPKTLAEMALEKLTSDYPEYSL